MTDAEIKSRNDRHFFCFVGVLIGIAPGIIIGWTLGGASQLQTLQPWQTLIASLIALGSATVAFFVTRMQIKAGFANNDANLKAAREAREAQEKRADKPHKDCAQLIGTAILDCFNICEKTLETTKDSMRLLLTYPLPEARINPEPRQFDFFRGFVDDWTTMREPALQDAINALTPSGRVLASYLLKRTEMLIQTTADHVNDRKSATSGGSIPNRRGIGLGIIAREKETAEGLRDGTIY